MLGETPVLYGLNAYSAGVVLWDRFAQDNYNSVTLARSGACKSYFTKLEVLRLLYQDVHVAVIDPEDEYRRLCDDVASTHIPLGAPGTCFNPFDLPQGQGEDTLIRRALFHSLPYRHWVRPHCRPAEPGRALRRAGRPRRGLRTGSAQAWLRA